ncbi:hypothetical protein BGZ79_005228, partial [Entomortierella chlamydospora]
MVLFSSSPSEIPPGDMLEIANEHLKNAQSAGTPTRAILLCRSAEVLIMDAEDVVANKRVGGQALTNNIISAYQRHGKLLEELGQQSKAQKSYRSAEKWGRFYVTGQHTRIPQSNSKASIPSLGQQVIFTKDITPPIAKFTLPEIGGRVTSTNQLAYCISLLYSSLASNEEISKT